MGDYWKGKEREIAGMLVATAEAVGKLISAAEEDEDLSFLVDTKQWLLDRSHAFAPPGEPDNGYPPNVVSMDAYKALLPPDRPRTRGD